MNPWLAEALAESRAREIRHATARFRAGTKPTPWPRPGHDQARRPRHDQARRPRHDQAPRPARDRAPRAGLRGRLGYALVEAGLHMLAAAGPAGRYGA
jgi:hypothetical protein